DYIPGLTRISPRIRQHLVDIFEIRNRQAELPQIISTLRAARRLAGLLHCGQQQRDEHADDRDDNEQLDQRKGRAQTDRWVHGSSLPQRLTVSNLPSPRAAGQRFWPRRSPGSGDIQQATASATASI